MQILKGYEGVQEGVPPGEEYEYSEMMLYKALILEEAGKCTEALQCMGASKDQLKDPLGHKEAKARLLVRLGRQAEAATTLRSSFTSLQKAEMINQRICLARGSCLSNKTVLFCIDMVLLVQDLLVVQLLDLPLQVSSAFQAAAGHQS